MNKIHSMTTSEQKKKTITKSLKTRRENLKEKLTKEEWDNYVEKKEFEEYRKELSNQEKLEIRNKKVSETWAKKTQEEIDERSKKIYETKIKNNSLNKRPYGFGFISQELFWYLDDNIDIKNRKPIYATMQTRDITCIQNDEQLINVSSVSKTKKARRLDFYLKFNNKYSLCIEFDEKAHKNYMQEDLEREKELLNILSDFIILRVKEEEYLTNKQKIQNELLLIIKSLNDNNFKWGDIPQYLYPIYKQITNN